MMTQCESAGETTRYSKADGAKYVIVVICL